MNNKVRIGIVGTGMIANVLAKAFNDADNAVIAAISSRSPENAKQFSQTHNIEKVFASWQEMMKWQDIDAVYIGVPTIAKEEIVLEAAKQGKHILVDKPFTSYDSVKRMTEAARMNNVAFMDATHFVHHPRTQLIQDNINSQIGDAQAIVSSFFFPFLDRSNIRYNTQLEPTGALGDMAWYSVRAIIEYLPSAKIIKDVKTFVQRDTQTNAIYRAAGLITFEGGATSTWNIGYNAGVCIMDLDILGTEGLIKMDDFVLDWSKGFAFDDDSHQVGYTLRKQMATPKEFEFIKTPSSRAQTTLMVESFANLTNSMELHEEQMIKSERTQYLLDAILNSVME